MNWYLVRSAMVDYATNVCRGSTLSDAEASLKARLPTVASLLWVQTHEDYITEGGFDPIHLGM